MVLFTNWFSSIQFCRCHFNYLVWCNLFEKCIKVNWLLKFFLIRFLCFFFIWTFANQLRSFTIKLWLQNFLNFCVDRWFLLFILTILISIFVTFWLTSLCQQFIYLWYFYFVLLQLSFNLSLLLCFYLFKLNLLL